MAAELLDDRGAVVVVVVLGVAVVAVDELTAAEAAAVVVDDCPDTVVGVAAVEGVVLELVAADVDVVWVVAEEWAVVLVATRTPSPTAPAVAARPMPTVARRTRVMARSRSRAAAWGEGWCDGGCSAMAGLSVVRRLRWNIGGPYLGGTIRPGPVKSHLPASCEGPVNLATVRRVPKTPGIFVSLRCSSLE